LSPAATYISGDTWKVDGAASLNGHATFSVPGKYVLLSNDIITM